MKYLHVNTKVLTFILFFLILLPSCNNEEIFVIEESAIIAEETEPTEEETPNTEDEVIPIDTLDDTVNTMENTPVDIEAYLNDINLPQSIIISNTSPSNGVLTINNNDTPDNFLDDTVVYTPNAGFSGMDSFDYTVCDATNAENCDTATVSITVNPIEDDFAVELKAFPGAEGYGKNALGGRGGRVIKVTNLNDSGAGSFREACEASGPRIVTFDIGGRINLSSTIKVASPFLTIAGQTAPGDGITLSVEGTPNTPVLSISNTNDVIIRYLTIRCSEFKVSERNSDGLTISNSHDVIVDHCSFSWASDENIAIFDYDGNNRADTYNITIQNCLIDTAWGGSDKGIIASGGVDRLTFYNLLFTSVGQRQPLIKNETGNYAQEDTYFEIINTVTFEGKFHASFPNNIADAGLKHLNYINNLCIDSGFSRNMLFVDTAYPVSIFVQGNISPLRTSITSPVDWDEEWSVIQAGGGQADVERRLTTDYRVTTPNNTPIIADGVQLLDAVNLFDGLKSHVGASYPTRDSEDLRAINDVETKTSTTQSSSGTFPILDSGTPSLDSDNDGMTDTWEDTNGYNKSIDDSAEDRDGDGYTNIEEYLNVIYS